MLDTAHDEGFEEGFDEGMQKGMRKGMQKGMQKGIEEGRRQGMQKVALNMIQQGLQDELIISVTGLSLTEISSLKANVK